MCEGPFDTTTTCSNCNNKGSVTDTSGRECGAIVIKILAPDENQDNYKYEGSGTCFGCGKSVIGKMVENTPVMKCAAGHYFTIKNADGSIPEFCSPECTKNNVIPELLALKCTAKGKIVCPICGGAIYCKHGLKSTQPHYYCSVHDKVIEVK